LANFEASSPDIGSMLSPRRINSKLPLPFTKSAMLYLSYASRT
jgi:hypothetical protein